jgi:methylenetetrahydrofolate reductase (NADPH)
VTEVDLPRDVQERLVRLLQAASIEIAPKAVAVAHLRIAFDPGTDVFVNQIPEGDDSDVVATAVALRRAGFQPVPHVAARNVAGPGELDDYLERLVGEAGVSRVLAIAGDRREPRGPYASVLDLLATGRIEASGIGTVGVAGHPEANPFAALPVLEKSLAAKCRQAASAGLACFIVTQFCFDADPLLTFLDSLDRLAIDGPVRIGVAGPAATATLIKFAERCGVGQSLETLRSRPKTVGSMIGDTGPEGLLHDFAAGLSPASAERVSGVHFYPFGGIARTSAWLETTLARLYQSMSEAGAGG